MRKIRVGSRVITASPVYDTYWRFACERQAVYFRRVEGQRPPWTEDPIISGHRFTNVYRAADRVSQYLIRDVIYEGDQAPEEVFFRTVLFKLFNRIETWEHLRRELGTISWHGYNHERFARVLDSYMDAGNSVYSGAYIMPSPPFGSSRKHRNHLMLIEHMVNDDAPKRVANAASLEGVFKLMRGYPSLGDFLAFQLAIDLNYSALTPNTREFSETHFVVAGPGALDGISKCFPDTGGMSAADIISFVRESHREELSRLGLCFRSLWGRPLQLIDCQNLFCEISKYARVAHPGVKGVSGRMKIKQKFKPGDRPLRSPWFPPKWGINAEIPTSYGAAS